VCSNSAISSADVPRRPFSWRNFIPFFGLLLNLVAKDNTRNVNSHKLAQIISTVCTKYHSNKQPQKHLVGCRIDFI
jgi:hypothetical protein